MQIRDTTRFSFALVSIASLLLAGCDEASPIKQQETPGASADQINRLPDWLRDGPDGWSEEAWLEYQTFLIELRSPILRSRDYAADELIVVTAEVEHWPSEYEDKIKQEWLTKWQPELKFYERTGGCGCCNEVYTVTGPKAAIEEFPNQRRGIFPRYVTADNGG